VAVPAKKRRSPQEKKRLSYSKDRRNDYGENDKSSRRNIARSKRFGPRAERRFQHQELAAAVGPVDEEAEAIVHESVTRPRPGERASFRKWPDVQLGIYIARSLARRAQTDRSAAEIQQARIKKVVRNTAIDGKDLPWARARYFETEFGVGQPGAPGTVDVDPPAAAQAETSA
jgi:hypothetical protein